MWHTLKTNNIKNEKQMSDESVINYNHHAKLSFTLCLTKISFFFFCFSFYVLLTAAQFHVWLHFISSSKFQGGEDLWTEISLYCRHLMRKKLLTGMWLISVKGYSASAVAFNWQSARSLPESCTQSPSEVLILLLCFITAPLLWCTSLSMHYTSVGAHATAWCMFTW